MIDDVNDVYATAQLVLEEINNIFSEHEGEVSALPSRQFITAGGAASQPHDCEQVVVTFSQIYTGLPGAPTSGVVNCQSLLVAVYHVEIVRMTLPDTQSVRRGFSNTAALTPEQENAIAQFQTRDARLLLEAGRRVGDHTGPGSTVQVSVGAESGGYQAVTMTVQLGVI